MSKIASVEYYEDCPHWMQKGHYKPYNFYVVRYKTGRYRSYTDAPKSVLDHIKNLNKTFCGYDKFEGYNMYTFQ